MAEAKVKDNKEDAKKVQALDDAIKQIEKKYGKGSVMKLGDRVAVSVDVIPTGSLTLDLAFIKMAFATHGSISVTYRVVGSTWFSSLGVRASGKSVCPARSSTA